MASHVLNSLVEKTSHWDKDERYMATYDLCTELGKDGELDVTMERRICGAVLKQLDDVSNDVQSIAVKCLGILMKKIQHEQVVEISEKLCTLILNGRDELRDIYSIGLKTLITDMHRETGRFVAQYLTDQLVRGASQDENADVKLVCLDNLADLLRRFGDEAARQHGEIINMSILQLQSDRQVVRKRATTCMGALATSLSEALLEHLVTTLLRRIEETKKEDEAATLVQAIGTVSRTVGFRMARHLDTMIPLFWRTCGDVNDEGEGGEQLNDLRESCFQAFTALLVRCPKQIVPHLDTILQASLTFMCYDPNYTYEDDDGEADMEDDEDYDDDYDDDDYQGSDDDDSSWKVRRSALKTLESIIWNRPEMLAGLLETCGPALIKWFKEREEMVRLDVIACYKALVEMAMKVHGVTAATATPGDSMETEGDDHAGAAVPIRLLQEQVPQLANASVNQLKGKSVKTKAAIAGVLSAVCTCVAGCFTDDISRIVGVLKDALDDKKATQVFKLDVLTFLRTAMERHAPQVFHSHLVDVTRICERCAAEDWYKVTSEALRLAVVIARILRPIADVDGSEDQGLAAKGELLTDQSYPDYGSLVQPLYQCILPRLQEHDIDQEIKECAIAAAGAVLRHCGDALDKVRVDELLGLVMERLQHETSRLSSLRAIAGIATSPLTIDLGDVQSAGMTELCGFLRQQNRALKQNALQAPSALCKHASDAQSKVGTELYCAILKELAPLVADDDLRTAQLALQLTVNVLNTCPEAGEVVTSDVLPKALSLARSPLLQGGTLQALLKLFRELVLLDAPGASFDDLLSGLKAGAHGEVARESLVNVACGIAAICAVTTAEMRHVAMQDFLRDVEGDSEKAQQLGLLCVGEIGRRTDLSGLDDVHPRVLKAFESTCEDTKAAAGIALGALSAGNVSFYLPKVLEVVNEAPNRYLAMTSLKELIVTYSRPTSDATVLLPHVPTLTPALMAHCESEDEAVRSIVAECLGVLVVLAPNDAIPSIQTLLGDSISATDSDRGWKTRWTLATAMKFAMGPRVPIGPVRAVISDFLQLLRDPNLAVKRAALLMLNSALHHQSSILADQVPDIVMPALLEVFDIFIERVVDLGPFKHKVDDGLPLRKAALSCVYTGLDRIPEKLDVVALMPKLAQACGDKAEDMCLLAHQVVIKVSLVHPGALLGSADAVLGPLEKVLNKKQKQAQAGHEVERRNELLRSALRALLTINSIDKNKEIRRLQDILDKASKKEHLAQMMASETALK